MPEKKERPKMEFPTNIPQTIVLGEQFYQKEHPEYGWSFGWNLTQDGEEKVMFVKEALNIKLLPYPKGSKLQIVNTEKKGQSGKPYHEWVVSPLNGTKPLLTPTAQPPMPSLHVQPDMPRETSGFKEHLLACADIANLVATRLKITDDQARQACFATVCIDAQKQGVVLDGQESPKPVAVSPTPTGATGEPKASAAQRSAIITLCSKLNLKSAMPYFNDVGCLDPIDLTQRQAGEVIDILQSKIDAGK